MKRPAPARLAGLSEVSEAMWQAEQARFREVLERQRAIEAAISRLDTLLKRRFDPEAAEGDPAILASAEIAWRRWGNAERDKLLRDLARIRAESADQRDRMKRTFGRYDVLRQLTGKR
ncbi:hypothetical protein AADZ90_002640 [Aestuariibius sp. 2305UL40-4]|uniref:hypothetical protein n=1 Tax=Aestuariibius violaceus TaxID=3234132 RepID=UPI00345E9D90